MRLSQSITSIIAPPAAMMTAAPKLKVTLAILAAGFLMALAAFLPAQPAGSPFSLLTPQPAAACGITGSGSAFKATLENNLNSSNVPTNASTDYGATTNAYASYLRVRVTAATPGNISPVSQWCNTYKYNAFGASATSRLWTYMGSSTGGTSGTCDFIANSRTSHRGYFWRGTGSGCATNTWAVGYRPPGFTQGNNVGRGHIKVSSCTTYAAPYAGYVNSNLPFAGGNCEGGTGFNPFILSSPDRGSTIQTIFYDTVAPAAPNVSSNATSSATVTWAHAAANTSASAPLFWIRPGGGSVTITGAHTDPTNSTSSGPATFTWAGFNNSTGWSTGTSGTTATATRVVSAGATSVSTYFDMDSNDRASNDGANRRVYMSIDSTKPTISFGTMVPALGTAIDPTYRGSTAFTVVFNATDTQSGFGATYAQWSLQRQRAAAPSANDTCNGLTWANDGSAVTGSTSASGQSSAQTLVNNYCYRWLLNATDSVSNVSTQVTSGYLLIDTTKPTGSIVINNGAEYTNSRNVTLQLEGSNQGSGTQSMCLINGTSAVGCTAWENFAVSKAWTLPVGDGTKTVSVIYRDGAGNISISYSDSIILDTTVPPTTTLTATGTLGNAHSGTQWYRSSVNVQLTGNDATSGVAYIDYLVNGSPDVIEGDTGSFTLSGDGEYVISQYLSTDNVGYQQITSGPPVSLSIDTSSPEFTLASNEVCTGSTGTAQYQLLGLTDNGGSSSDVERNTFFRSEWWDGGSGAPAAPGVDPAYALPVGDEEDDIQALYTSPSTGTNVMHVRIYDAAGNAADDETLTVIFDGDGPVGSFSIVPSGVEGALDGYTNTIQVTLDLSGITDIGCSEELASIRVSYDGGDNWTPYLLDPDDDASADILLPADGPITVSLVAIDMLGNASAVGAIPDQTIFLDTLSPEGEQELNYGDEYTAGSHIMISPAATDPGEPATGSGAYQVQFSNDDETWGIEVDGEFVPDEWADFTPGDALPWTLLATEIEPGEEEAMTVYVRYRDRAGNISGVDNGSINLAGALQPEFAVGARIYANCDGSNETINQTGNITWSSGQRLCLMPTVILVNEGREYVTADGQPCPPSTAAGSACRQIRGYIETDTITINGEELLVATPESLIITVTTNPNQSSVTNCEGIPSWDQAGGVSGLDWREFCFSQATSASGDQLFAAIPFTVEGLIHWEFSNPQADDPAIAQNDIPFTLVENLTVDVRNLGQSN